MTPIFIYRSVSLKYLSIPVFVPGPSSALTHVCPTNSGSWTGRGAVSYIHMFAPVFCCLPLFVHRSMPISTFFSWSRKDNARLNPDPVDGEEWAQMRRTLIMLYCCPIFIRFYSLNANIAAAARISRRLAAQESKQKGYFCRAVTDFGGICKFLDSG